MSFINKYSIIVLCFVTLLASCKQDLSKNKENAQSYDGQTLSAIKSNVIELASGDKITLVEDSISKIFYLTRHAEKDTSIKGDSPLTEAGFNRAAKISDIMRGTRVDAIYSTMMLRSLYTVDSLADIKAMAVLPYDNKTLKATIDSIKTNTNFNRIFVVGHSNTIPAITNSLAGRDFYTSIFDDSDYGNFVIVVLRKSGQSDVYRLRY